MSLSGVDEINEAHIPYTKENLGHKDYIIYSGKLHWIIYCNVFVIYGIIALLGNIWLYFKLGMVYNISLNSPVSITGWLGVMLLIIGISVAFIEKYTTEYVITNEKVIKKVGLIRRETHEINTNKIETVNVNQSILGRLLGYGTVNISGTGSQIISIKNISNPLEFKKWL